MKRSTFKLFSRGSLRSPVTRRKTAQVLIATLVLLLSLWTCIRLYDLIERDFIGMDFAAYWSSVRLLLAGENPYSAERLESLQRSVGWSQEEPLIIYNPPSVLTYILPFSMGEYPIAKFLWMLIVNIVLTFACVHWLWGLYGGKDEHRLWSIILLGTFAPFYFMIAKGQIVPLVLVGLVGFLYFQKLEKDILAGIFIAFIAIKPHAVYLFLFVLLLWLIQERRWQILAGAVLGNFIAALVPVLFNPAVFSQYVEAMLNMQASFIWATPTLGTYFRLLWGGEKHWLQFAPIIFGMSWLFFHWYVRRESWNWNQEMPLLLLMSLMTSFYCWVNDYALLIIPMIQSVALIISCRKIKIQILFTTLYLLMNAMALIAYIRYQGEYHFIWYPPSVLVCYSIAMKLARGKGSFFVHQHAAQKL